MAYEKPVTINLIDFKEEALSSGRKLLHLIFKQKFGTSHYRWTPPWKGDFGVEKLFLKALKVEEWNDYEGVWSEELRKVSKEIPSLDEIRLPVKIAVGELTGPIKNQSQEDTYRVAIEVLTEEERAYKKVSSQKSFICIGEVEIPWDSLSAFLFKMPTLRGISKGIEDVIAWSDDTYPQECNVGVRFWVWLKAGAEKTEYLVIGKELAANIRSFIRKRLSDHQALKRGFEEI